MKICSKRATRTLLESHWNRDIPKATVEDVNAFFNEVLDKLAQGLVTEHIRQNERRKKYHLKPKLRLSIHKNVLDEIFKHVENFKVGIAGESNINTAISENANVEVV